MNFRYAAALAFLAFMVCGCGAQFGPTGSNFESVVASSLDHDEGKPLIVDPATWVRI
jgi:hypothetical protein